jgi:hypothetical protein
MRNMFWFQLMELVTTLSLFENAHNYNCILSELCINSTFENSTYLEQLIQKMKLFRVIGMFQSIQYPSQWNE